MTLLDSGKREIKLEEDAVTLRKAEEWSGKYRDVSFSIRKWYFQGDDKERWNYYIFLDERMFTEEERASWLPKEEKHTEGLMAGRVTYDYYGCRLAELEWHCGITYCERLSNGHDGGTFKAGCDYSHYWDEGQKYWLDDVYLDVKTTIDSLWDRIPNLLVWDIQDGKFKTVETREAERQKRMEEAKKKEEEENPEASLSYIPIDPIYGEEND